MYPMTPEQFLDWLYYRSADDLWAEFDKSKRRDFDEALRCMIEEGLYSPSESKMAREDLIETRNLKKSFRGKFARAISEAALLCMKQSGLLIETVPVGILPTGQLNACAIKSPSGGAVIILDHGMFLKIPLLLKSFLALSTYDEPEPFCRDHSKQAFQEAIQLVALHSVLGDVEYLNNIRTWDCPSLPKYNSFVNRAALIMEWDEAAGRRGAA